MMAKSSISALKLLNLMMAQFSPIIKNRPMSNTLSSHLDIYGKYNSKELSKSIKNYIKNHVQNKNFDNKISRDSVDRKSVV